MPPALARWSLAALRQGAVGCGAMAVERQQRRNVRRWTTRRATTRRFLSILWSDQTPVYRADSRGPPSSCVLRLDAPLPARLGGCSAPRVHAERPEVSVPQTPFMNDGGPGPAALQARCGAPAKANQGLARSTSCVRLAVALQ
ncbi:hypothetical protein OJAV_G00140010 [Oryzias javanicus]|uniref:Uncharacterized protein n=1 Tax=Oryzias javanicus TaxID=123683 RepID=A0A3S2PDD1_ORYJA|nr:hypothetical protein OJAV_G00140010 [Oryzias javanicus]